MIKLSPNGEKTALSRRFADRFLPLPLSLFEYSGNSLGYIFSGSCPRHQPRSASSSKQTTVLFLQSAVRIPSTSTRLRSACPSTSSFSAHQSKKWIRLSISTGDLEVRSEQEEEIHHNLEGGSGGGRVAEGWGLDEGWELDERKNWARTGDKGAKRRREENSVIVGR